MFRHKRCDEMKNINKILQLNPVNLLVTALFALAIFLPLIFIGT